MKKEDLEKLQESSEKKAASRAKRKKSGMRVSGKSVFKLQRIITGKKND